MNKIILLSFLILITITSLSYSATVPTCTFTWDAVTKYTDGQPITLPVIYTLYGGFDLTPPIQFFTTKALTATFPNCGVGTYYITAKTSLGGESVPSNIVPVTKQVSPTILKVTQ